MLAPLYGLALIAIVAAYFRPQWGFVLLIGLAAFTRELGTGIITRRVTPFDVALAGLLVLWVIRSVRQGRVRVALGRLIPFAPVLLFAALAVVRAPWVPRWDASFVHVLVYSELVAAAVLTVDMAEEHGAAWLYRVTVCVMTLVALICLYEFAAMQLKLPVLWEETYRILGPFKNPNQTGSYLALGMPLVLGALAGPKQVRLPAWFSAIAFCLQGLALFLTFSRTSIVAAAGAVGLFYMLLAVSYRRDRHGSRFEWQVVLPPLLVGLLLAGLLLAQPKLRDAVVWKVQSTLKAFAPATPSEAGGFSGQIFGAAIEAWEEHPLWGVGLGNFPYANPRHDDTAGYEVHGSFLATLAETGLVGAALMLSFLFSMVRRAWQGLWLGSGPLRPLLAGATAAMAAMYATGVWDTFLRKRHFWLLVGLFLVLAAEQLAGRIRRSRVQTADGLEVRVEPDITAALDQVARDRFPLTTPYVAPPWLGAWFRHAGQGLRPEFLMVYRQGRLVGYGPFGYRESWGLRRYQFLGQGLANYLEPGARPGQEEAVARALVAWFRQVPIGAVVACHDLNSASPAAIALNRALSGHKRAVDRFRLYDCPHICLNGDWETVLKRHRSRKDRNELQRTRRHLALLGEPEFRVWSDPAEAGELLAHFPELQRIYRSRFRGVLNSMVRDEIWSFLADVVRSGLGHGFEVCTLQVQGRTIAFAINSVMEHGRSGYLIAIDPAFRSLGPGQLLLAHLFEHLCERRVSLFDFGKGSSTYKEGWQDGASYNEALVWWVRTGLGGLLLRGLLRVNTATRLWLRRRRVTSWLRKLPKRLFPQPDRERCQVETLAEGAPPPLQYTAPVLPAIAALPVHVQDTAVRLMSSAKGSWQAAVDPASRTIVLLRNGREVTCITWKRSG